MNKRILVIDDDPSVRDALKNILEVAGYVAVLAPDGDAGVKTLAQQAFDLLILDLDLPKLTGFDILDLLSARSNSPPILILTGMADQCDSAAMLGADALLEKPPDVWLLLNTVEQLLAKSHRQRVRTPAPEAPRVQPIAAGRRNSLLPWRSPLRPVSRSRPGSSI
jgi:DNA-binding response OmpR family regulator